MTDEVVGILAKGLLSKVFTIYKQPSIGVLIKRCSESMQQMYRSTPMLNCDFNKVAKQL